MNIDGITVLYKGSLDFAAMAKLRALRPFSDETAAFLSDLSAAILADPQYKAYPDAAAFAFFVRKANLRKLRAERDIESRLGRGLTFHIAPSNVPVNFAYSLAAGLLSGNPNIIKVSSQNFPQVRLLCETIANVAERNRAIADYIAVVQYANGQRTNDYFSSLAQARVIWGGDETIARLRQSPVPARSVDIAFANRYSLFAVNADAYAAADAEAVAAAFYTDTYFFDQNACFSPRLVYWAGERVAEARERFWAALHAYASKRYAVTDRMAAEKLMALHRLILNHEGVRAETSPDNLIVRCALEIPSESALAGSCAYGFFVEYIAENLSDLRWFAAKNVQTMSYFGFDRNELVDYVVTNGLAGIDRVVEIGKANEFSLVWDGADLITALTRIVS